MKVTLRKRELKDGRSSLYLDVYHSGQRSYEFLNLYLTGNRQEDKETRQLAEQIRAKRQLQLQSRGHGYVPEFHGKANFIEFFESESKKKNPADTAWPNTLKKLEDFAGPTLQFRAITEEWLEAFQEYLLEKLHQNTARLYYTKVKAALNKAEKKKIIPYNPADHVDNIQRLETERVYLTEAELQKLANTECRYPELKRAFIFACYTGLRISDIRSLKWKHIRNGKIHFQQQKTKTREYLPISDAAKRLLGTPGKRDKRVFSLPSSGGTVGTVLRDWTSDAKVNKDITFHVSRHTFAVRALSNGVDIYTVSKLMGHKNISTTQVYADIVDKKKEEAVNKLPDLNL